jgi:AGZA family xanthine/uracil permease-like MFS transporter
MGLAEYFELQKQGSSVKTEVLAGATTFLAMAYIILVNPTILHAPNAVWGQGGMPLGPVVIATIVSAGVATILTGIYAKRPFAMAPYMGENALFAFSIIPLLMSVGYSGDDLWRLALGAVFWGGVIFLLVSVTGVRTIIARAIPSSPSPQLGGGDRALSDVHRVRQRRHSRGLARGSPVKVGNLASPRVLVAITGTAVTLALYIKRVPGSILLGMLVTMAIAAVVGVPALHPEAQLGFPNWGEVFGRLDVLGALRVSQLIPIIVLLFLVDIFDTLGTVAGLAAKARYTDEKGRVVGVDRVFHVDAAATILGGRFRDEHYWHVHRVRDGHGGGRQDRAHGGSHGAALHALPALSALHIDAGSRVPHAGWRSGADCSGHRDVKRAQQDELGGPPAGDTSSDNGGLHDLHLQHNPRHSG